MAVGYELLSHKKLKLITSVFNITWMLKENRNDLSPLKSELLLTGGVGPPTVIFFISLNSSEFLRNHQRGWHYQDPNSVPRYHLNGQRCIASHCLAQMGKKIDQEKRREKCCLHRHVRVPNIVSAINKVESKCL